MVCNLQADDNFRSQSFLIIIYLIKKAFYKQIEGF